MKDNGIKNENCLVQLKKQLYFYFIILKTASSKFKNCLMLMLKYKIPQTDIKKTNPKRKNKE